MASAFKKFVPLFDRVLVQRLLPEAKSKGGILIPEKSMGKVLIAEVKAVGEGTRTDNGDVRKMNVSVGEQVLLPEYGGTKVTIEEEEYHLFREGDILGKWQQTH
ncbi:10 kDa heat shock protein, mitochondrial-like [Tubulanus polymorphus]|uniref:10 kDa heat shock protein, mitochondrial-like n=1 Tax=Tubulanus polymorphus TaxID=672921 RepID=UPI003DA38963